MKIYNYKAIDSTGKKVKGNVEAQSESQAVTALKNKKLVVISLKQPNQSELSTYLNSFFSKVSSKDLVTFTRQLSTMVNAGLPLSEALTILKVQLKPNFGKIISDIVQSIQGGSSFGDALEKHSIFPQVYVSLVRAGEAAGVLDEILLRLSDNLEKQHEFKAKTRGALLYPVIVIIGMGVVMTIMMIFVIPKLTTLYQDFNAELPITTRVLIATSNFFVNFWYVVIFAIIIGIYAFQNWRKTKLGRHQIDKFVLSLPVFGNLKIKLILTEFTRTLALLIGAGITIIEALNIVSKALDNVVFKEALDAAAKDIETGQPLAEALVKHEIFPPIVPQMVSVGEETGKLDEVLKKVSLYFEAEAENVVRNLSTAIEPFIIIVLGLGVGFLIVAIILPIYNLTSQF